jgi:hypothetical protein
MDDGELKRQEIIKFSEEFRRRNGRYPTFWFDKVCINMADSDDHRAITVLPVTIGACDKVLVLLSPSYLKRIWCIWELQAVFAFCLRELAVDRIVVVDAGGGAALQRDAQTWSLDDAHCFDPNEELRLRGLADVIGIDRFVNSVRSLAACKVVSVSAPEGYRPLSG